MFPMSRCSSVLSRGGAWFGTAAAAGDSVDIVISSLTELRLPHPTVANDTLTS